MLIPECKKYHDHERQKEADDAYHRCQIWIDPGYAGHVKDDDRVVDENVEATELEGGHQSQAEGQLTPMRTQHWQRGATKKEMFFGHSQLRRASRASAARSGSKGTLYFHV